MQTFSSINPATEEIIETYPIMPKSEVNNIINEMHHAQLHWSQTKLTDRLTCFIKLKKIMAEKTNSLAKRITQEMGKPIAQATSEVKKCIALCEYYIEQAEEFLEPEKIKTDFKKSYRAFNPLGIIFAIMPWNYPFWQVFRFAVPNLIAGNAGLLKHAPNCMGAAIDIENLFQEAGFPQGLFRSIIIDTDLAPFIIEHPLVAGVTLTGSNRAGKSVGKLAGFSLKKIVLELGGIDPYVVLDDANLDLAADECVKSRLNNAGQVCISAKRIIITQKNYTKFADRVLEKAKTWQLADPADVNTRIGPMARADIRKTVDAQLTSCISAGAQCVLGGKLPTGKGYFYPPSVLLDVRADSPAFKEEIFGPVICLISATDEADAIRLANQTDYGLSAAIFTEDLDRGENIARNLIKTGFCAVNSMVTSNPRLPFGGIRQSGHGRELSKEGMREFMNIKTITIAEPN